MPATFLRSSLKTSISIGYRVSSKAGPIQFSTSIAMLTAQYPRGLHMVTVPRAIQIEATEAIQ